MKLCGLMTILIGVLGLFTICSCSTTKVIINQNELPDECYSGVKKDSTVKTAWNSKIPNVFTVELDSISEVIIDPRDESKIAEVFDKIGFATDDMNINIIPLVKKNCYCEHETSETAMYTELDCSHGRMLTQTGVYNCPLTSDDYRGRSGGDFKDFSRTAMLEYPSCSYCMA